MERDAHDIGPTPTDAPHTSGTERIAAARTAEPEPSPATGSAQAETTAAPAGGRDTAGQDAPLLSAHDTDAFGRRWETVQADFLDAPRKSVEHADALVADVMQRLAEQFAQERERLENQWSGGEDVSTEDLRVTLQRYRSFFRRLLSA